MALVTILLHFPCARVHSRYIFKIQLDKLAFFAKSEIRLELKLDKISVN